MADIFREVDEDLRRENFNQLWKKYGAFVVAAAVALVVVTAAVVGWREWRVAENLARSERLLDAGEMVEAGNVDGAIAAYRSLAEDASGGHELLARLREAALAGQIGEEDQALAAYEAVVQSDADTAYRGLATLLGVMRDFGDADPDALIERLAPLTDEESAWRYSARELTALLEQRRGNADRSVELLTALEQAPDAPPALRNRAREALATMGAANDS